ncbi:MAG TPA: hypothetical protein VK611_29935 [Acidimicrobiales bacterium]|nr:hypothetical protein [Acidimicrobiales bacterium]
MVDRGTGGSDAASLDREPDGQLVPNDRVPRWPLSAIIVVLIASVLVVVLLMMNVFGVQIAGEEYDPDVGGSMAEWFEAFATLVGIPAAVVFGVRQLQSTGAVLELERRQLVAEELERTERRHAEQAILQRAVALRMHVVNVLDRPNLATEAERLAVERLADEYHQRGWARDAAAGSWQQGSLARSNAEQLVAERSPLLPAPWFVAVECHNSGAITVVLERWTVADDTDSTTIDSPVELAPGDRYHHRLGADEGLLDAYRQRDDAEAACAATTVVLEGVDAAGRPFRIVRAHRR